MKTLRFIAINFLVLCLVPILLYAVNENTPKSKMKMPEKEIGPVFVNRFEEEYRTAYKYENSGLYRYAKNSYLNLDVKLLKVFKQVKDAEFVSEYLPLIVSSTFRLTIATAKENFYSQRQLSEQIEDFKKVKEIIEQVLRIMIDLKNDEGNAELNTLYSYLYFARAYNNLAISYKFLQGIAWHNYVVYPMADIIRISQSSMKDLEEMLYFDQLSYLKIQQIAQQESDDEKVIEKLSGYFENRFTKLSTNSAEYKVLRFINFSDDAKSLAKMHAKRIYYQSYKILDFYYNPKTQRIFAKAKENYTLENIVGKNNMPFFNTFDQLINFIKIDTGTI